MLQETKADNQPAAGFTVPELARRYRVSQEKVRRWIRRGELAAINTAGTRCGKPRFVVTLDAIRAFERGHAAAEPPPRKGRKKQTVQVDYFPD